MSKDAWRRQSARIYAETFFEFGDERMTWWALLYEVWEGVEWGQADGI